MENHYTYKIENGQASWTQVNPFGRLTKWQEWKSFEDNKKSFPTSDILENGTVKRESELEEYWQKLDDDGKWIDVKDSDDEYYRHTRADMRQCLRLKAVDKEQEEPRFKTDVRVFNDDFNDWLNWKPSSRELTLSQIISENESGKGIYQFRISCFGDAETQKCSDCQGYGWRSRLDDPTDSGVCPNCNGSGELAVSVDKVGEEKEPEIHALANNAADKMSITGKATREVFKNGYYLGFSDCSNLSSNMIGRFHKILDTKPVLSSPVTQEAEQAKYLEEIIEIYNTADFEDNDMLEVVQYLIKQGYQITKRVEL